jgi:Protein of unknown function (DUF3892)
MADYQIVCVVHQTTRTLVGTHDHIVRVGTKDAGSRSVTTLAVEDVLTYMTLGHRFYTVGTESRVEADVEPFTCTCDFRTIRTKPDAETDNNLDALPECDAST